MSGFDVYMTRDVERILLSVEVSVESTAQMAEMDTAELRAYRRGVQVALLAVGVAFGLEGGVVQASDSKLGPLSLAK